MVLTRLCSHKYVYRALCDPYKIPNVMCYYYAVCFGLGICAEMILKKQIIVLLILSLRFYFTKSVHKETNWIRTEYKMLVLNVRFPAKSKFTNVLHPKWCSLEEQYSYRFLWLLCSQDRYFCWSDTNACLLLATLKNTY